ncbi:MAG: winged helix-turn-helix transcriptional regulator [Verrucomicrobia bacterium]|nr:winged helix-turn-helix transcriptional regulator [Verrucomicrobiota bacterium]
MKETDERIFQLHAEVCKCMANPTRLKALAALQDGEKSVNELAAALGLSKSNLSQHLAVLRHRRIVATRRAGLQVFYRCANPKMLKACGLLREVLMEQLAEGGELMKAAKR